MKSLMILTCLFLACVLIPSSMLYAQENIGILPCTDDELEAIHEQVDSALASLRHTLLTSNDALLVDLIEDSARSQRSFSYFLPLAPDCAETYTMVYPAMFVLDEYSIAFSLTMVAQIRSAQGDESEAEDILYDAKKHVREAERMLERRFPEFYSENFEES